MFFNLCRRDCQYYSAIDRSNRTVLVTRVFFVPISYTIISIVAATGIKKLKMHILNRIRTGDDSVDPHCKIAGGPLKHYHFIIMYTIKCYFSEGVVQKNWAGKSKGLKKNVKEYLSEEGMCSQG